MLLDSLEGERNGEETVEIGRVMPTEGWHLQNVRYDRSPCLGMDRWDACQGQVAGVKPEGVFKAQVDGLGGS